MKIEYMDDQNIVCFRIKAESLEDFFPQVKVAFRKHLELGYRKFLVDRHQAGTAGQLEASIQFGKEIGTLMGPYRPRVAVLMSEENTDEAFITGNAYREGANVVAFLDEKDAIDWLNRKLR